MTSAFRRAGWMIFGWIAVTVTAMLVFLAGWIPPGADAAHPRDTLLCYHLAQLVFVLFVWPFLQDAEGRLTPIRAAGLAVMQTILLMAISLPLAIVSLTLSDMPARVLIEGQILILACGVAVAAIIRWGLSRNIPIRPWYVLGTMLLLSLPPLVYYFVFESVGRPDAAFFLVLLSPVWGVTQLEQHILFADVWLIQSLLLIGTATFFTATTPHGNKGTQY